MGIRGMKLRFFNAKRARDTFAHGESRATLLETLVALAVLGPISVALLSGPVTTSRAAYVYETTSEIVAGVLQHDGPTDVISRQVSE